MNMLIHHVQVIAAAAVTLSFGFNKQSFAKRNITVEQQ